MTGFYFPHIFLVLQTVLTAAVSHPYLAETGISALKSQLNEGVNYLHLISSQSTDSSK